jgi:transcriptional repressor NrdR
MNCPYCNHNETKVTDSRESKDGNSIKRRRECLNCGKRFTTLEKIQKLDLEVEKSNGEVEEFRLSKIKSSLLKAAQKRPITLEQIESTLDKILEDIKKIDENPIKTKTIGMIVLKNLKDLDEMAFLKYAIVHRNFSSIDEFMKEISSLKNFEEIYK